MPLRAAGRRRKRILTRVVERVAARCPQRHLFSVAFGKHAGKPLREVPRGYLSWMAREGVATGRGGGLDDALRCLGYDVAAPISERQRRPEVDLDDVDDVPF